MAEFFAAECEYRIVSRENVDQDIPIPLMSCDSQGMLSDRVTAHCRTNIFGSHFYRHLVSSILLTRWPTG